MGKIDYGVLQGSVFGPLFFSLYVNHINQAVDYDLFLHTGESCLVYQYIR